MNIQKIFIALCGLLLTVQTMNAQENMYVLGGNGAVDAIPTSQVDYSTFNADDSWFTITNDGLEGKTTNSISASCTVALATDGVVKKLGVTPEIDVCYSKNNTVPTTNDDCQTLGNTMGSYTFTLSTLFSGTTYYYRVYVKLGDEAFYGDVCNTQTLGTKPADNSKTINGHKFIDLGLPSGLLWAETNIGATTAADDGNYCAWGETGPQGTNSYSWNSYKHGTSSDNLTKYNATDGKTSLDKEDDAAYINWGSSCRMPTNDEFEELLNSDNCTWTWTSKSNSSGDSIIGYEVTSVKNGNSIFLPASGYRNYGRLDNHGLCGYYWSNTLYSSYDCYSIYYNACYLYFGSSNRGQGPYARCGGPSIRPVAEP